MRGWAKVETKPNDQGDQQLKAQEVKPLVSSDAQVIATPSAQDKQIAESGRTSQSSGSLAELALKTRGLSREQIAAQMEAQGDSISIDYGNGQEASRKTGLTEKELVQVGSKAYDAKKVVAYDNQGNSSIVSDATNATAVYETDKSKIVPKQVEVQPTQVNAGLDYNRENVPFSQKISNFVQSAEARLMDPAARKAYLQGMIDKTIGVGVGLNEVKEEIKGSAQMAATKARSALEDGSVATFMAQPNAINEPLFKSIGTCFDAMRKDPSTVNNVLAIMGRELETANNKYTNMTPYERGVQDGKAMFFFINPSGSTGRAIKVVDSVAAKVDPIVEKAIQDGLKAAEKLAKESPEYARKAQEMVLDYAREHGLTPRQLETIGVPNQYLEPVGPLKPTETSDTINAMSKAEDLGGSGRLVSKGVDATGKALKFSEESGIELGELRLGQDKVWEQAPFPRGNDVHVVLGENLPAGTKTIDRVVIRDGIAEGQKSIDLTADSYNNPAKLESKLKGYIWDMQLYSGHEKRRMSFRLLERQINEKVLHIGIRDGSITNAQREVFEKLGKGIQEYNKKLPFNKAPLKIKVTVVK